MWSQKTDFHSVTSGFPSFAHVYIYLGTPIDIEMIDANFPLCLFDLFHCHMMAWCSKGNFRTLPTLNFGPSIFWFLHSRCTLFWTREPPLEDPNGYLHRWSMLAAWIYPYSTMKRIECDRTMLWSNVYPWKVPLPARVTHGLPRFVSHDFLI